VARIIDFKDGVGCKARCGGETMKTQLRDLCLIIAGILLLFPFAAAASADHPQATISVAANRQANNTNCKESLHGKDLPKSQRMPVYRPPLRGAPAGRVAGGTRGVADAVPFLCTLVPEHVGLTVSAEPLLCFFLQEATNFPLEFTIIEHHGISPLVETQIAPPLSAGIHVVCLADYGKQLKQGVKYKWFVALIPDEQHRAKDVLAAGGIERVIFQDDLKRKLKLADAAEISSIYAETGIWYDALANLSRAIVADPGNKGLVQQRAFLLEQVGLSAAAQYESKRFGNN